MKKFTPYNHKQLQNFDVHEISEIPGFCFSSLKIKIFTKNEKSLDLLSVVPYYFKSLMRHCSKILTLLWIRAFFVYEVKKQRYLRNRHLP